jgi:serine/threonine protein kinase
MFQGANLVKFYNSYNFDNEIIIVMEYCEGGDLRNYLDNKKSLSEKDAVAIIKQIMNGL